MQEDQRCCGSDKCIINSDGYCWCGQKWVGNKQCEPDSLADSQFISTDVLDKSSKKP
jgi:hypothetical protein